MDFPGCVAVISHDRYFLNRVCTDILAFEGGGRVVFQHGDYQYYLEKRAQRLAAQQQASQQQAGVKAPAIPQEPSGNRHTSKTNRLTWKEQRELEGMEDAILAAEEKVASIEAIFADPNFHEKYGARTQELTQEMDAAKAAVENLYARWEELSSKASLAGQ